MSDVPSDILVNILSRLPVEPLLRFRCVSKPWCALIDSPRLIKAHLNRSIGTESNQKLVFGGESSIRSVDLDSLKKVKMLDIPLQWREGTLVIGLCHGLMLLSRKSSTKELILWNPSIRKYKKIEIMEGELSFGVLRRLWLEDFGYDCVNDDYKIVRVQQGCGFDLSLESIVYVYSLKTDSWHQSKDFPYYLCPQGHYSAYVSGALHWLVSKKYEPGFDYLICGFDLGTEEYRLVPLPENLDMDCDLSLAVLGGCLCLLCSYHKVGIDLWVMKDYGVKESWVKLISFPQTKTDCYSIYLRPLAYSKDHKEVLLQHAQRLLWYNIEKKRAKILRICGMPKNFVADTHMGSLVQPKSSGPRGTNVKNEPKEKRSPYDYKYEDFLDNGLKHMILAQMHAAGFR